MNHSHLDHCKALIEEKLGWGASDTWSTQDFEELSVRIQDTTSQVISSTTLKRIWGRVSYDNKPSRHSLDTLTQFLGYESWREFTTEHPIEEAIPEVESTEPSQEPPKKGLPIPTIALSIFMLLLGAAAVLWLGTQTTTQPPPVQFASRPVAQDLPNTVVFEYDVRGVQADSFFIQQSWDRSLRQHVSSSNSIHSSTYFYPGYYSAKLIADNEVLMEHPVHIKTQAWKTLLEEYPKPIYLPEEALLDNGTLGVSKKWLDDAGYPIDSGKHVLGYYLVQDFGPLHMDNFSMEFVVSHIKSEPLRPCQGGLATVRGEDGIIQFPFDIPGCTGLMRVTGGDIYLTGETSDLSSLGADYANWQHVKLQVKDKNVRIQIGTNQPLTFAYSYDMGKMVGLWFQFVGRGMIDEIRLSDEHTRVIYEEEF